MNKTPIEWTDYSSNPIYAVSAKGRGWYCERVSPGCAHCYSAALNVGRFGNGVEFLPGNRDQVEFQLNEKELAEWSKPKYIGKRVFVCDMTDLFGEWVPNEWLYKVFEAMGAFSLTTFQVLTKRPERMREWVSGIQGRGWPLPNVWLGVSVENQHWADERIPVLLDTPAAVRFISYEPALKSLELRRYLQYFDGDCSGCTDPHSEGTHQAETRQHPRATALSWVIVGGESGPKHRPFNPAWARSIVQQCREADVACFVKQLGGARPGNAIEELPADLRVREFPATLDVWPVEA